MEEIYRQIQFLLYSKVGEKLGWDASRIGYVSEEDSGPPVSGSQTGGTRESITIPDEYMSRAGAHNAAEFLAWLQSLR